MKHFVKSLPEQLKRSLKSHLKKRQVARKKEQRARQKSTSTLPATQAFRQQVDNASSALSRSGRSVNQLYRRASGQALSMAVKAQSVGELPKLGNGDGSLTFYVLKEYARSNSILVDLQAHKHGFPAALSPVQDLMYGVDENAGLIFLHHPEAGEQKVSPRLARLVTACREHPTLKINLVPVSILWGRAPDKEDSLFKLLMADNWEEPTVAKQLFNIGVMGRDTFVQFHAPMPLQQLLQDTIAKQHKQLTDNASASAVETKNSVDAELEVLLDQAVHTLQKTTTSTELITAQEANFSLSLLVGHQLDAYLDAQRRGMLGPDLSDKRNLIDTLIYSPAIKHACQLEAKEKSITPKEARKLARGYANEIVNDYAYPVIRFFDHFLTWLWTQMYDGVEVHNIERVRALSSTHELVYVPCHRSHMDYLLLAYVIYKQGMSLPYVAAGNNLDVPVIGPMLRRAIAFYIRRSFKDNPLYKAVLKEYLHILLGRSTPIEYFIEGGRSRSGRLLPPKLGMLAMTVHSQLRSENKPVAFIPTYIGYERIMEGGTYISELKGKPKESESFLGLIKAGRHIERIFGVAHVNFGTPLHLNDFMQKFDVMPNSLPADRTDTPFSANASAMVDNLSVKIMQNINKAAVINPISLLALVLLSAKNTAMDEARCLTQLKLCQKLAQKLPYHDDTHLTTMNATAIINYGIKLKIIERTPHILGDMIHAAPKQAATLSYFRNNILHTFILPSFLAALVCRNGRIKRSRIDSIVKELYPFVQSELFLYRSIRNLEHSITQTLDVMIELQLLDALPQTSLQHSSPNQHTQAFDSEHTKKLAIARQPGEYQHNTNFEQPDDDHSHSSNSSHSSHHHAQVLSTPELNSIEYGQLSMLATLVTQSLERYFMTLALLAEQGTGKLTTAQVIDLCHLLGQRLSTLYADDMPDFFDKALFTSFIATLKRMGYVSETDNGILMFDHRIHDIASHAHFVLSPDVMQVLHNVASLNGEQIEHAIDELTKKRLKRFRKRG